MKFNNYMIFINLSPWPILLMMNIYNMIFSLILYLSFKLNLIIMSILLMMNLILMNMWKFNSMILKKIFGYKNFFMNLSMKNSIYMFILSELTFFLTFFYIYFSNKFFSNLFFKNLYMKIFKLNFSLSILNSIILLTSSITMMIHLKIKLLKKFSNKFILKTILLSMYFIMIQLIEYKMMNFNMNNSIFFSTFFLLTSFHMFHVMLGTYLMFMLSIIQLNLFNNLFIKMKNLCWYWHFIDFIWILIMFIIY